MASGDKKTEKKASTSAASKKSPEEIINGFNQLRNEQRSIANKIYELESDLNEHKVVIENLKPLTEDRKCFRLIGGVLVETTIKDVLPNLTNNIDQIKNTIENLNAKLIEKGKEVMDYKEKNNIQFHNPDKIIGQQAEKSKLSTDENTQAVLNNT